MYIYIYTYIRNLNKGYLECTGLNWMCLRCLNLFCFAASGRWLTAPSPEARGEGASPDDQSR